MRSNPEFFSFPMMELSGVWFSEMYRMVRFGFMLIGYEPIDSATGLKVKPFYKTLLTLSSPLLPALCACAFLVHLLLDHLHVDDRQLDVRCAKYRHLRQFPPP